MCRSASVGCYLPKGFVPPITAGEISDIQRHSVCLGEKVWGVQRGLSLKAPFGASPRNRTSPVSHIVRYNGAETPDEGGERR